MLDKEQVNRAVQRLHQAEKSREQIRALSLDHPEITIEDAYAIQRQWVDLKIAEGRTLKGHKIGLTSRAMQVSSQITEPDYGALLDDMFFNDGSDIPIDRFIVPRVEVELAFVLAKPLRGRTARCSTSTTPPTTSFRRWRSSMRAATTSIPRRSGRARCSTPSPTTPPTPGW